MWSLKHWGYLVGMSPVLLPTVHSPTKYVISGKAKVSSVSSQRLAKLGHCVIKLQCGYQDCTANTYSTICSNNHVAVSMCVHSLLKIKKLWYFIKYRFKEGFFYDNQVLNDFNNIWLLDGSCSYFEGSLQTGYAAVKIGADGEIIQTPKAKCLHQSQLTQLKSSLSW